MRYTEENSINDILNDKKIMPYLPLFFQNEFIEMIEEEKREDSLQSLRESIRMPWGAPYLSELLVASVNAILDIVEKKTYTILSLWGEVDNTIRLDPSAKNKSAVCLMIKNRACKNEIRPAVIICPGGGYVGVSSVLEGLRIAERMEKAGYQPFVLNYRVKPNAYPAPQLDLALAVKYVRANAEKYQIDTENVMITGFSAGGHVCAIEAGLFEELEKILNNELEIVQSPLAERYRRISARPDKVSLNYARISYMLPDCGASFQIISGGEEKLREKLSAERNVTERYPKTFLWICEDDEAVNPEECRLMEQALAAHGVEHLCRIYPTGGHGIGLGKGTSAENWMEEMLEFMK